ncbi:pilus assembly protein PilM [Candidatus Uhrbacteria bacterium]|nr:pilus assembly protein PilM [Candidatus Uhrbacteria bacterium]
MNVGSSITNISVVSNGVTVFNRDIARGGSLVTEDIARKLGISLEEALGYQVSDDEAISDTETMLQIRRIEDQVYSALADEIARAIEFYENCTMNAKVESIYLSGGASQSFVPIRRLERRLQCYGELVNPFKNIAVDNHKFEMGILLEKAPIAAVAVGLARRFRGDDRLAEDGLRINLYQGT